MMELFAKIFNSQTVFATLFKLLIECFWKPYMWSVGFCTGTFNPLSANHGKWLQTTNNRQTKCLNVFYHFVGLALKGLCRLLIFEWSSLRYRKFSQVTSWLLLEIKSMFKWPEETAKGYFFCSTIKIGISKKSLSEKHSYKKLKIVTSKMFKLYDENSC